VAGTFLGFELTHGPLYRGDGSLPSELRGFAPNEALGLPQGATHYGFVLEGTTTLGCAAGRFTLQAGMYFAVPGSCSVGGPGRGVVMSRLGFSGTFMLGGPIEPQGRLRYIDGCTDSLLVGPPVLGDPCLNHLHIPAGTRQTQHTHPSLRE
jgi:hypothetical protein